MMSFFKMSAPAAVKVEAGRQDKVWKRLRLQSFITFTLSYALY